MTRLNVSLVYALGFTLLVGHVLAGMGKEPVRQPPPPLAVTEANLQEHGADVQSVLVEVHTGKGMENPQWTLTFTNIQVLLGKLHDDAGVPPMKPAVLALAKDPEPAYKGITVTMKLVRGGAFQPLTFYKGKVTTGRVFVKPDVARALEYWLFSTARVRRDLNLGARVLPVWTFEQCRVLGMNIVDTQPRQCLLPDGGIVLQTTDDPTKASLATTDFDNCLKHGVNLVATFPRRCVVAGGKVFTEPPRVEEPEPVKALPTVVSEPQVSVVPGPTVPVLASDSVVVKPSLGHYVVSVSTLDEGYEVSSAVPVMVSATVVSPTGGTAYMVPDVAPAAGPLTWQERVTHWWGWAR